MSSNSDRANKILEDLKDLYKADAYKEGYKQGWDEAIASLTSAYKNKFSENVSQPQPVTRIRQRSVKQGTVDPKTYIPGSKKERLYSFISWNGGLTAAEIIKSVNSMGGDVIDDAQARTTLHRMKVKDGVLSAQDGKWFVLNKD